MCPILRFPQSRPLPIPDRLPPPRASALFPSTSPSLFRINPVSCLTSPSSSPSSLLHRALPLPRSPSTVDSRASRSPNGSRTALPASGSAVAGPIYPESASEPPTNDNPKSCQSSNLPESNQEPNFTTSLTEPHHPPPSPPFVLSSPIRRIGPRRPPLRRECSPSAPFLPKSSVSR